MTSGTDDLIRPGQMLFPYLRICLWVVDIVFLSLKIVLILAKSSASTDELQHMSSLSLCPFMGF